MEGTIAAISTAMSASGIGIVRISGEDSLKVIAKIYRSKKRKKEDRRSAYPYHSLWIYLRWGGSDR